MSSPRHADDLDRIAPIREQLERQHEAREATLQLCRRLIQTSAKAIRHMLEDDVFRGNIGAAGRAAYEEGFTEQRVVERYLSFFQQVVS